MRLFDQGNFTLYVHEFPLARTEFEWRIDGAYKGTITFDYAGQTVSKSLVISVNPPIDGLGRWKRIDFEHRGAPATVVRDGKYLIFTQGDLQTSQPLVRGTNLVHQHHVALFGPVLRAYDVDVGGEQVIPIYAIGHAVSGASVERQEQVVCDIGGRDVEVVHWRVDAQGEELEILSSPSGMVFAVLSRQRYSVNVRDGYEPVLSNAPEDARLSPPEHEVSVLTDVAATMRDGITLRCDVYRPAAAGRYPIVLIRTPYKKEIYELKARYFARRGYAYVVQDVRGRFSSDGLWEPFVNEREDGYDSVEWVAQQSWSNGRVGMLGGSYLGWAQWLAAVEKPPHLVTIIPNVAPPDPFLNLPYEHGVFFLKAAIEWAETVASEATADISGHTIGKIRKRRFTVDVGTLPVVDLDRVVLGGENRYWREWIAHPVNDYYWRRASYLDELADVDLPVFHQSGWFDGDSVGSKLAYARLASHGHPWQKLVLGPWGHSDHATRFARGRDFGPEAVAIEMLHEYLRWFDRWLKEMDNGVDDEPKVHIFAMGSNRWLTGNTYPLEGTQLESWYLHADGVLGRTSPVGEASCDDYVYDPGDPTPDPDHWEEPEREVSAVISAKSSLLELERWHDDVVNRRPDILVYSSAVFEHEVTFAGPVSAVLYASSSAVDTDWHMRVVEVDDNGRPFTLTGGRMCARFRDSLSEPELLQPHEVYEFHLDLWQTGATIKPGHRVRVEVASAAFPTYARNLNTGRNNGIETNYVSATQTIWHTKDRPSHVVLPRVPTRDGS